MLLEHTRQLRMEPFEGSRHVPLPRNFFLTLPLRARSQWRWTTPSAGRRRLGIKVLGRSLFRFLQARESLELEQCNTRKSSMCRSRQGLDSLVGRTRPGPLCFETFGKLLRVLRCVPEGCFQPEPSILVEKNIGSPHAAPRASPLLGVLDQAGRLPPKQRSAPSEASPPDGRRCQDAALGALGLRV